MPQMAPMIWLMILLIIFLASMLLMSILFSFKSLTKKSMPEDLYINNLDWKW